MKKSFLFLLLSSLSITGCSLNEQHNVKPTHIMDEDEEDEREFLEDEYTVTIETHGKDFAKQFNNGTNFSVSDTNKTEELRQFFEKSLQYSNLLNSLVCDYCAVREYNNDTYLQIGTGNPSKNNFNIGTLKWSSKTKIYNVELIALNYANPYEDYQTGNIVPNVDTKSHIWIDNIDKSMEISSNSSPKEAKNECPYPNGSNSFTLKATGGRVLIKEIKITWRG